MPHPGRKGGVMMQVLRALPLALLLGLGTATVLPPAPAVAATAAEIDARAEIAYTQLLRTSAAARALADQAVAVLVFPSIVKAGLGFGGQYGEGVLRRAGVSSGYYNIAAASFGFQIGAQSYSEILFFMTEDAVSTLNRMNGFELGADAGVTVANEGLAVDATSKTVLKPIVVFISGQQGLMAGATIEGSKISRIHPK